MSDMIERVARAIAPVSFGPKGTTMGREHALFAARAAIEAMRLPNARMLRAAMMRAKIDFMVPENSWASGYNAMIDAALEGGE